MNTNSIRETDRRERNQQSRLRVTNEFAGGYEMHVTSRLFKRSHTVFRIGFNDLSSLYGIYLLLDS